MVGTTPVSYFVKARMLNSAGSPAGPLTLSGSAISGWCGESAPNLASDGSDFLLSRAAAGPTTGRRRRTGSTARTLLGGPINLNSGAIGGEMAHGNVAFDGSNYFVVWFPATPAATTSSGASCRRPGRWARRSRSATTPSVSRSVRRLRRRTLPDRLAREHAPGRRVQHRRQGPPHATGRHVWRRSRRRGDVNSDNPIGAAPTACVSWSPSMRTSTCRSPAG